MAGARARAGLSRSLGLKFRDGGAAGLGTGGGGGGRVGLKLYLAASSTRFCSGSSSTQSQWWSGFWRSASKGHGQGLGAANNLKLRRFLLEDYPFLSSASNVLDVGVGAGRSALQLLLENPGCRCVGLDCSTEALLEARRQAALLGVEDRFETLLADVGSEDFPRVLQGPGLGRFDAVMVLFVLESLPPPQDENLFKALRPHLLPGGLVAVRDYAVGDLTYTNALSRAQPDATTPEAFWRRDGRFLKFWECTTLTALAKSAGYEVVECKTVSRSGVEKRQGGKPFTRVFLHAVLRKV